MMGAMRLHTFKVAICSYIFLAVFAPRSYAMSVTNCPWNEAAISRKKPKAARGGLGVLQLGLPQEFILATTPKLTDQNSKLFLFD